MGAKIMEHNNSARRRQLSEDSWANEAELDSEDEVNIEQASGGSSSSVDIDHARVSQWQPDDDSEGEDDAKQGRSDDTEVSKIATRLFNMN
jgi:hypothetical protein